MNRTPDFDELMEGIQGPEERERLRRVHELLVQAGPPPELSPALASAPSPEQKRHTSWLPRPRLAAVLVLAGALTAAAFGIGYLVGDSGDGANALPVRKTVALTGMNDASGVVKIGFKGADGNWPMVVTVSGLEPLYAGDYYRLALTKHGKPIVTCGTFNVSGGQTTVRMIAAYNLKGFDGWVVTLWNAQTHDEQPVLWTTGALTA
jgi:hypothetical protein